MRRPTRASTPTSTASGRRSSSARLWALVLIAAAGACAQEGDSDQDRDRGREAVLEFVSAHHKGSGTFGPKDQEAADATWTWWAWRCREILGEARSPAFEGTKGRDAVLALRPRGPREKLWHWAQLCQASQHQPESLTGPEPPFLPLTTWVGSPPLSELEALVALQVAAGHGLDRALLEGVLAYWRGKDGGYRYPATLEEAYGKVESGGTFTAPPRPSGGASTAGATAAAVRCLVLVGAEIPARDAVLARLAGLRHDSGGYVQGNPEGLGPDLWATYHALRAIRDLDGEPAERDATVAWIAGLRHRDGGFAHGPAEPASLEATWLALESLQLLRADLPPVSEALLRGDLAPADDPGDLKLFQAVVEMGSDPGTCVVLAAGIGADLLLIKTLEGTEVELARRARRVAALVAPALDVACVREEHLKAWGTEGVGYVTHCSDIVWDPDLPIGTRGRHPSFDAILGAWREDRARGTVVFSCSYLHRELLAPAYDRSCAGDGYDAIMATWAFTGDGALVRDYPWLHRYVGRIAVIGNHDAHGDAFHWLYRGLRTRTLFFAKTPDVAAFQDAVRKRRVVAVAHGHTDTTLFGHPHWVAKARAHVSTWDRGRQASVGPWLPPPCAFPLDASTRDEMPALEDGFGIVVRAAGRLADDAMPSEVQVTVGGNAVELRMPPVDHDGPPALWAPLPGLKSGRHEVRITAFGRTATQTLSFVTPAERRSSPVSRAKPSRLAFEDPAELPFVRNTSLAFGDFEGSVRIVCNRADFLLGAAPSGTGRVRFRWQGGASAGPLSLFLDGTFLGHVTTEANAGGGDITLPVPAALRQRPAHRLTLRTQLPPWISSFDRPPSDLLVLEIACLEDA